MTETSFKYTSKYCTTNNTGTSINSLKLQDFNLYFLKIHSRKDYDIQFDQNCKLSLNNMNLFSSKPPELNLELVNVQLNFDNTDNDSSKSQI